MASSRGRLSKRWERCPLYYWGAPERRARPLKMQWNVGREVIPFLSVLSGRTLNRIRFPTLEASGPTAQSKYGKSANLLSKFARIIGSVASGVCGTVVPGCLLSR